MLALMPQEAYLSRRMVGVAMDRTTSAWQGHLYVSSFGELVTGS